MARAALASGQGQEPWPTEAPEGFLEGPKGPSPAVRPMGHGPWTPAPDPWTTWTVMPPYVVSYQSAQSMGPGAAW